MVSSAPTSIAKNENTGEAGCAFQAQVPVPHCPLQVAAPATHTEEHVPCVQVAFWFGPVAQTLQLAPHAVGSEAATTQRVPHTL
jgi:hypothetical protein